MQAVKVEHLFPFSSEKKRMATIVRHRDGNLRLYTKGASEIVLDFCGRYVTVRAHMPMAPCMSAYAPSSYDVCLSGTADGRG
jgi:magnesium-transporting ATPase (P-type)